MEHAVDTYYQKNNISSERLVPKMGKVGLNLESMELAVPKENQRLIEIEEKLNSRIVGQPEAIKSIMTALGRGEFRNPRRPIANLFFMGPTGVGKTETAQELAAILNDGDTEGTFLRIDCSMITHGHEVSSLVGAPPGYVGRAQPAKYAAIDSSRVNVVLYDEIEKAHPDLHNQMLQILDNGEIDLLNSGENGPEKASFRNSIIIATSNVGSKEISKLNGQGALGFSDHTALKGLASIKQINDTAFSALKDNFPPEFIGRFNDKIVFRSFDDEQIGEVLDRYVVKMNEREHHRAIDVELAISPELRDKLVAETDRRRELGARPVLDHFENTVGREYAQHIVNRTIPWKSLAYAVPAEQAGLDPSTTAAAFYFESLVSDDERLAQEMEEELLKWFEQRHMAEGKMSKPNRRSKKVNK